MESKRVYPQNKSSNPQNHVRVFSESMKRKKVREYEQGLVGVTELSRSLEVSRSAIYKWIRKYSLLYKEQTRLVVESKSDTKKIIALQKQLAETERLLGQKQIQLEFSEKLIELASKDLGIDLKKKYNTER